MAKMGNALVVALLVGGLVAGVSGCRKEGPAERAGREIDRSVEKFGKEIEKAGEKIEGVLNLRPREGRRLAIHSDGVC